jgi:8-amino-7-oxononanoate synthase
MIDFASALYLGMRHASSSLRPWTQITAGKPAAMDPVEGAQQVAAEMAALQGCEAATLGTSTLHLVWDIFGPAGLACSAIYVDEGAYPILRWGVERAAARGVVVRTFRHHDAQALALALWLDRWRSLRPVVVTDGLCPGCGSVAPLAEYLECALRRGGGLLVDDTQALGILGRGADASTPYGHGGGGSLQWSGIKSPHVVALGSMAKGFGVPAAVISGSRQMVRQFEAESETRMHCSPPSTAAVRAAESALQLNRSQGERLRARLAALVARFRQTLMSIGLVLDGGLFPVQTISTLGIAEALELHKHLLDHGVRTVLHRGRTDNGVKISFLINASHRPEEIDYVANVLSGRFERGVTANEALYALYKDRGCPCSQT